ncbi:MAG: DHH family phosphoesterase [Candidatus Micrarchaeaceae archaeon]
MKRLKDIGELAEFIITRKDKKTLITFHSIGDRDCIGSSIPLSKVFENVKISTPDYITKNSLKLLENLSLNNKIDNNYSKNVEFIIILDSNRFELLGNFKEFIKSTKCEVLFVDHHELSSEKNYYSNQFIFNDENYNSASGIIYEVLKKLKIKLDIKDLILLINGIVSDSANFQNSSPLTFLQIYEILNLSGFSYSQTISSYQISNLISRKNILNDLLKSKIIQKGNYLIVSGIALHHANLVAEAALNVGADLSVFYSIHENEVSISARLRSPLDKELNINLGKLMEPIGQILEGTGGGHPCAAGAYGRKREAIKLAFNKIITETSQIFISKSNK